VIPTHKTCTTCGEVKPLDHFYRNKEGQFGHQARCKVCACQAQKDLVMRAKIIPQTKKCAHCGETKPAPEFNQRSSDSSGLHPRCRKCQAKYRWSPKSKYRVYKQEAAQRHIGFEITLEEFKTFWQAPCSYCGSPIDTIGIDRVDNTLGYVMGNLTSCCCSTCNYSKRDLSRAQWVAHMTRVLAYLQKHQRGD